ncbi:hypothetical protein ACIBAH_26780 [Streptomyces sp. NPDC051445]|uniref:hypothetical protein n=1 Tax=Streptomyces sp. NPDC051445 TaxID=3365653 RepID=UPI0037A027CD
MSLARQTAYLAAAPFGVIAPFVVSAGVSVISFLFSKVIEARVGAQSKTWQYNSSRLIALSNWAADAGQAMAAALTPVLGLIVIVSTETPAWVIAFYSSSAFLALGFGLYAAGFASPVTWATKFWKDLPPAATICFFVNVIACILVIVFY